MKTYFYCFNNGMGWICDAGVVVDESKEKAVLQLIRRGITFVKPEDLVEVRPGSSYVQSRR